MRVDPGGGGGLSFYLLVTTLDGIIASRSIRQHRQGWDVATSSLVHVTAVFRKHNGGDNVDEMMV